MSLPPHLTSTARGTYSEERGTPGYILDVVRKLYGPITHDLCSGAQHNRTVRAAHYWSLDNPCPEDPQLRFGGCVWCNPPGGGKSVRLFWDIWCRCVADHAAGGFMIYNLDHWRSLRAPDEPMLVTILAQRVRYLGLNGKPARRGSASFPGALVTPTTTLRNRQILSDLGHVVRW